MSGSSGSVVRTVSVGRACESPQYVVIESPYGAIALTPADLRNALAQAEGFVDVAAAGPVVQPVLADRRLLCAREAAALLGVKPSWLLQRAREGRIPHFKIGKYRRFDLDDLREMLERDGTATGPR